MKKLSGLIVGVALAGVGWLMPIRTT